MYYRLLLTTSTPNPAEEQAAKKLWTEMGGTEQGFAAWRSAEQDEAKRKAIAGAASRWTPMLKSVGPLLSRTDLTGRSWSLADLQGKTTVIVVWASWCAPCRAEIPAVEDLFQRLRGQKDLQMISLTVDKDLSAARKFVGETHLDLPVIPVEQDAVDATVGMSGVPRLWLVDGSGNLRFESAGYAKEEWPAGILAQVQILHP